MFKLNNTIKNPINTNGFDLWIEVLFKGESIKRIEIDNADPIKQVIYTKR